VHWHPKKDTFAITMIEDRHHTGVWVWIHGKGLRKLSSDELFGSIAAQGEIAGVTTYGEFTAWKGDDLYLKLEYSARTSGDYVEHEAQVRWNSATDKLVVIENKIVP
jgi:hypothetical protein